MRTGSSRMLQTQPETRAVMVSFIRPTAWKSFSKARLVMFTVANRKTMVE